jgi:dTDP-glucose 4,6-dehydratase
MDGPIRLAPVGVTGDIEDPNALQYKARSFRRLLVTGGAGFIGSCYVRDVLARRDGTQVTVLDKLTYAGNEANLAPVAEDPEQTARLRFVRGDIADRDLVAPLVAEADGVVNFAAESHVDRSILDPEAFLATGVIGVHVLVEACRVAPGRPRFLQVSTDEVYGSVDEGHAGEDASFAPRSPYAAAKAAGELLVRSYVVTHGLDAVVTRGSNTYGPYHHPGEAHPLFITNAIDDAPLPLYGDGLAARLAVRRRPRPPRSTSVLRHGDAGDTTWPAERKRTNREVVTQLLARLGKPWSPRPDGRGPARPRSAVRDGRLETASLGWRPERSFEDGLAATVDWFRANEAWWRAARSGGWDGWYERQYGHRLATGEAASANALPDADAAG